MSGRGAWNVQGVGGTKQYKDSTKPGPYYYLRTGYPGTSPRTADEYAVWKAVLAYQKAVARRLSISLTFDGLFGPQTSAAVLKFQNLNPLVGIWGGIGPDTSRALLIPDLKSTLAKKISNGSNSLITPNIVSGTVKKESLWDAGAVGYYDPNDLGLGQINGPAHPLLTKDQRLDPIVTFGFIVDYYNLALANLKNNVRDAIASYNLGSGGVKAWISDGRPDVWTPAGETRPREVKLYIDTILAG